MREYKNFIVVFGIYGKIFIIFMLFIIFEYVDLDLIILVGGNLSMIGGNVKIGNFNYFIIEVCEYVDSFFNFNLKIFIVLNVEEDYFDYFFGIDEIKVFFNKFGKLLFLEGYFIINGDDENIDDILYDVKVIIIKYGRDFDNDVVIKDIYFDNSGYGIFRIEYEGRDLGEFEFFVYGFYNIYNVFFVIMVVFVFGIDLEIIRKNIKIYKGVGRRFEIKGYYKNVLVVDDYVYYLIELKVILVVVKKLKKLILWCIF